MTSYNKNSFNIIDNYLLPEPLDELEEKKLFDTLNKNSQNILVERNLRLVLHIASRYGSFYESLEDLFSIGTIGLIKAVKKFDTSKNIKFSTYAGRCIENEILLYIRKNSNRKNDICLHQVIKTDDIGNELLLEEILPNPDDIYSPEYSENMIILKDILKNLSEKEKEAIKLLYVYNFSQKEVAKELNFSQSYISKIKKSIINSFKNALL